MKQDAGTKRSPKVPKKQQSTPSQTPTRAQRTPKQERSIKTRDMLLDVAGQLLADVGIERISTNLICQHAKVTPPALYHYFDDKYAVIEALGLRLVDRQMRAVHSWIERRTEVENFADVEAHLEELLRDIVGVTESEPGGLWIERAISAIPSLEHVRNEARRNATDVLTQISRRFIPDEPYEDAWTRMRVVTEFGYVVGELLRAQSGVSRDATFTAAAKLLAFSISGWMRPPRSKPSKPQA